MSLSPSQRRLASSIGGMRVIARYGAKTIGRRAHAGAESTLNARLLAEINSLAAARGEELTDEERAERLRYSRSAHFKAMALKRVTAGDRKWASLEALSPDDRIDVLDLIEAKKAGSS